MHTASSVPSDKTAQGMKLSPPSSSELKDVYSYNFTPSILHYGRQIYFVLSDKYMIWLKAIWLKDSIHLAQDMPVAGCCEPGVKPWGLHNGASLFQMTLHQVCKVCAQLN